MTEYLANFEETIVHVCDPTGGGEYTFCGIEMQEGGIDPALSDGSPRHALHTVSGVLPNCMECKERMNALRRAMRGVRFSKKMVSLYDVRLDPDMKGDCNGR